MTTELEKFYEQRDDQIRAGRPRGGVAFGLLAGAAAVGVAAALATRDPRRTRDADQADRSAAFRSYLADHLTGADAALVVVSRLRASQAGAAEAALFTRLHDEFAEEREIVSAMVRSLGGSPFKMKRLVGQAAGAVLQVAAGGDPGELALFRTLESLAIGVQGKRCLWRVAKTLEPGLQAPTAKSFHALELQAVDQWQQIDRCRLALASRTFSAGR